MPDDHRPVWYLARGGTPVPASSKRAPPDAAWWCREGDEKWTAIEAKPVQGLKTLKAPQQQESLL